MNRKITILNIKCAETHQKRSISERVLFIFPLIVLLCVFFYLCNRQITQPKRWISDINGHILFADEGRGYSLFYVFLGLVLRVSGGYRHITVPILYAVLAVLPVFEMGRWISKSCSVNRLVSHFAAIGLIFLSSVYLPLIQPYFYRLGLVTQPWHNITYVAMKAFSLYTITGFLPVIGKYQDRFRLAEWVRIAVPLAISSAIKPSFLLAFSWALLIVLVIDAFRGHWKGKTLLRCVEMGTTVFPALAVLFFQSRILYGDGKNGIEIVFLTSRFFSQGAVATVIKLLRGLLLPAVVLIFHAGEKDTTRADRFLYLQYAVALIQVICLQETGPRANHGNFFWTIYICGYLLFGGVTGIFLRDIKNLLSDRKSMLKREWVYLISCAALLVWHLASGAVYFGILVSGGSYMK